MRRLELGLSEVRLYCFDVAWAWRLGSERDERSDSDWVVLLYVYLGMQLFLCTFVGYIFCVLDLMVMVTLLAESTFACDRLGTSVGE